MPDLPRYSLIVLSNVICPSPVAEGEWVKFSDVSSRLQQLEQEQAGWQEWAHWTFQVPREPTLTLAELRQAMCVNVDAREDALKARVAQLEQEKATLLAALTISRAQWIHSVNAPQCLAAIVKAEGR